MKTLWRTFVKTLHLASNRRPVFWLCIFLFAGAAVALIRDTFYQGNDFLVFWKAARHFFENEPIYSTARDGPMVFKYPPWILPIFLPFGLLSESVARWCFGSLNAALLLFIFLRLEAKTKRKEVLVISAVLFWGIWAVHALDGQMNLILLAGLMACFKYTEKKSLTLASSIMLWLSTAKIFTCFSALGFRRESGSVKSIGFAVLLVTALSLPAFLVEPGKDVRSLITSWTEAAASGGQKFGSEKIRERENQGFPAMAMRLAQVPAKQTQTELLVTVLIFLGFAHLFFKSSKVLNAEERFYSALAFCPVVHPLAWFHLFVLSFPLVVLSLDEAFSGKNRGPKILASVGILCVAVVTQKTFGFVGALLEIISIKSWGILACWMALIWSKQVPWKLH